MSVLFFAEHSGEKIKNAVYQAASLGKELAGKIGTDLHAVAIGEISDDSLKTLANYGVSKIYKIQNQLR